MFAVLTSGHSHSIYLLLNYVLKCSAPSLHPITTIGYKVSCLAAPSLLFFPQVGCWTFFDLRVAGWERVCEKI